MKLRVLILGYGEMGHAMEYLLADKHEIHIWSRSLITNLQEEVSKAQVILFCLPVNAHFELTRMIAPWLTGTCLCLTVAKGLDESGQTAPQIFATVLAQQHRYGVLYGPMISEEISLGRYAFADAAMSCATDFKIIQSMFQGSHFVCRQVVDLSGSCWSVILKNVYAIMFGISDELELGDNIRGHLMVSALAELSMIVTSLGSDVHTPYRYAGLGDLVATATSENSHHHELGRKLAAGQCSDISGEGVHTLMMVEKYQLFDTHIYPLFTLVNEIVNTPSNLEGLVEAYLSQLRRW